MKAWFWFAEFPNIGQYKLLDFIIFFFRNFSIINMFLITANFYNLQSMTVISIEQNVDTNPMTRSDLHWTSSADHTACNKSNTTGARCVTGNVYTSRVHSSYPLFGGVPVAGSLVFCLLFCSSLFVLLSVFFGHSVACSSIYGFWWPFWHLQAFPHIFLSSRNLNFVSWRARCPILRQSNILLLCDVRHNC